MAASLIYAKGLTGSPLDAAAEFHRRLVPQIRKSIADKGNLLVIFDPADYTHQSWRLAAVQALAREAAPCRINGLVVGRDAANARDETAEYLQSAPGVTGQMFEVDSNPANGD